MFDRNNGTRARRARNGVISCAPGSRRAPGSTPKACTHAERCASCKSSLGQGTARRWCKSAQRDAMQPSWHTVSGAQWSAAYVRTNHENVGHHVIIGSGRDGVEGMVLLLVQCVRDLASARPMAWRGLASMQHVMPSAPMAHHDESCVPAS